LLGKQLKGLADIARRYTDYQTQQRGHESLNRFLAVQETLQMSKLKDSFLAEAIQSATAPSAHFA
jgi:S-adenosylmethionine:diacylglycerol 3-amino-3-carboxypropyl transferase